MNRVKDASHHIPFVVLPRPIHVHPIPQLFARSHGNVFLQLSKQVASRYTGESVELGVIRSPHFSDEPGHSYVIPWATDLAVVSTTCLSKETLSRSRR